MSRRNRLSSVRPSRKSVRRKKARTHFSIGQRDEQHVAERVKRNLIFEPLEIRQLLAVNVSSMQLLDDNGQSDSDLVSSDPAVVGVLGGSLGQTSNYVNIEFDHNADGVAEDALTSAVLGASFTYDPQTSDPSLAQVRSTCVTGPSNTTAPGSRMPLVLGPHSPLTTLLRRVPKLPSPKARLPYWTRRASLTSDWPNKAPRLPRHFLSRISAPATFG